VRPQHFARRELVDYRTQYESLKIVVRFEASIVRWVRERQHFTWAEERQNGTIMVYRPYTFEQIEGWLLGWGDNMEVLEPVTLRERIAAIATGMAARHQPQNRYRSRNL
jgi:predicted DNA-binding transcriptional regulator YafY